ncbi:MAG: hypothetical protein Q9181_002813 [Wetmoreana brouardii]
MNALLPTEDFASDMNNVSPGMTSTEPVWEPQNAGHEDLDLTMGSTSPSAERARKPTLHDSLLSDTLALAEPRDGSTRSSIQPGSSDDGKTALHLAAEKGEQMVVRVLLDRMQDINVQDKQGRTALYLAVENKHEKVVETLVARRHGVDVQDHEGQTALHLAVAGGEEGIVEILLQVDVNLELRDNTGRTALHVAAQMGFHRVMQQLLDKGADIVTKIG